MENPKIRFKGFTKDWEQRKFADFTWDAGKRNKEDLDLEPYAITNEHGFIRQRDAHDDFGYMKDTDRKAYNIVQPNSFAYNPARINVGSIGYYKGVENVIVSSLYEVFQTDNYVNDRFLWHWLKSDEFPRWIEKLQEGSVRLYFYYDKLCECQLYMPSLEEQEKIASFLDGLDNLITLHQRKCEQTKNLKKYMLQKMFPQNGAKVPEIRFDGFTYDWEQRKVSEITKFHKQGFYTTEEYDNSKKYYLLRGTDLTENKLVLKDTPKIDATEKDYDAFKTEIGDFLIVRSGTVGTYGIVDVDIPAIFGSYLIDFRFDMEQVTNEFFGYFYQSSLFKSQLNKIIQASANTNINAENIKSTVISLPSLNEQRRISEYLGNLDNLITLHQRKCDELKKMKKYMLQNMFI